MYPGICSFRTQGSQAAIFVLLLQHIPPSAAAVAVREVAVIFLHVNLENRAPLAQIRLAGDDSGLFPNPLQSRHQNRQQESYDRYDHQKFYQCKSRP
jgi:hypothetical protein